MLSEDITVDIDTAPDRWTNDENDGGVGPQGEALILELRRLRRALDHERAETSSDSGRGSSPTTQRKSGRPKRPRKGKLGRTINVLLGQLGFVSPAKPRDAGRPRRQAASVSPLPRQEPRIASDAPSIVDLEQDRVQLNTRYQSMQIDNLRMELPPAGATGRSVTTGRLVAICRDGLSTSLSFLLNSGDAAGRGVPQDANLVVRTGRALEGELRAGLRVLLIVGVLAGGWAALVPLAGAVIVPGNLVVQSNVKAIQHPTGGVVAEIAAHNGMRVLGGDLLVRLDATQAQANLQVVSKQLDETRARIARLVAERDGLAQIAVPAELADRSGEAVIKALLSSEESLF